MKNSDLLGLRNSLREVGEHKDTRFSYMIMKNEKKVQSACKSLDKAMTRDIEGRVQFEKERQELCMKHTKRDENGKPVIITDPITKGTSYDMKDMEEWNKVYTELSNKPEHKEYFKKLEEVRSENLNLLQAEAEKIDFHTMKLEDLPKDLTKKEMTIIEPFIDEGTAPKLTVVETDK